MIKSFVSGLFHEFMTGRLRAEMPVAEENLIEAIGQQNVTCQPASQRRPLQNPFRLGGLAHDWRFEVPHVGAL
jgi:hypothetical protein